VILLQGHGQGTSGGDDGDDCEEHFVGVDDDPDAENDLTQSELLPVQRTPVLPPRSP
jgi:hypothetical protein